jgi:hypothetical protein
MLPPVVSHAIGSIELPQKAYILESVAEICQGPNWPAIFERVSQVGRDGSIATDFSIAVLKLSSFGQIPAITEAPITVSDAR